MPRGGYRKNAGRKSKWKNKETTSIRVPKVLVNQILEFAHKIDEEEKANLETVTESNVIDITGMQIISINGKMGITLLELFKAGYEIKPLELAGTLRKKYLQEINESK